MAKERPILFSGPMVRAILEGRKTQTRRVVKPQWDAEAIPEEMSATTPEGWQTLGYSGRWRCSGTLAEERRCPFGIPGDRLWIRETWAGCCGRWAYRADGAVVGGFKKSWLKDCRWKPSIHMPRCASRMSLEVVGVRVERVQEISEADAEAEGIHRPPNMMHWEGGGLTKHGTKPSNPKDAFALLWDSINAKRSFGWEVNPWVWVVEFKRLES